MAKYRWVVEFEIDEVWIEDGFNLTNERAQGMIEDEIPYALPVEVSAKVIKAPALDRLNAVNNWKPHETKAE